MSAPFQVAGRGPLTGFYFLYFASVGVTLPFLPAYFRSLGLSGMEIGVLLAMSPVFSLVSPPLFGQLADRTGRADRVLRLVAAGALLGLLPVSQVSGFPALLASMALYAVFVSSVVPLVDSLALTRIHATGGSYAHIRLFGSIGFVVSTVLFGFLVDEVDRRAVLVPLALIACYALFSFTLVSRSEPAPISHPLAGLKLLSDRALALTLVACAVHWIANAPFNATFSIHVAALGLPPWVVGLSSGIGVIAEVIAMLVYPRIALRIRPLPLLAIAFAASAVRWAGMAWVTSPGALVALSVLHGFTFGFFYVAAIAFVAARVPQTLRASGQGLFAAVTFGLGGLVGYLGAGAGYDLLGGHRMFLVATVLELAAVALVVALNARTGRPSG